MALYCCRCRRFGAGLTTHSVVTINVCLRRCLSQPEQMRKTYGLLRAMEILIGLRYSQHVLHRQSDVDNTFAGAHRRTGCAPSIPLGVTEFDGNHNFKDCRPTSLTKTLTLPCACFFPLNVDNDPLNPHSFPSRHAAASYGHLPILTYLISKGGNVNITDSDGDTPLYSVESPEVAQFLIDNGAIIDWKNIEGISVSFLSRLDFPFSLCGLTKCGLLAGRSFARRISRNFDFSNDASLDGGA
jgi:hypothetical protein